MLVVEINKIPFHADNLPRYELRYRNKYDGPDTFYDTYLLINNRCRSAFNMMMFEARHPNWRELHEQYNENEELLDQCQMPNPIPPPPCK